MEILHLWSYVLSRLIVVHFHCGICTRLHLLAGGMQMESNVIDQILETIMQSLKVAQNCFNSKLGSFLYHCMIVDVLRHR